MDFISLDHMSYLACARARQVPCLLPFAATFRFSPQKSGGRSDPTNQNVVLLQGRCAIIEVSLESRSPHTLELLSLDIEVCAVVCSAAFNLLVPNPRVLNSTDAPPMFRYQVHTVAAGKAAAHRLQRAGWTGVEGIDEAPDASSAFEERVPAEQAAMPLAVVTAVATPLPSTGRQGSPLLQEEGQISTHLFNVELPSACMPSSSCHTITRQRESFRCAQLTPYMYYACAGAADDVSLGRAVLRWRRRPTGAGTRAVNSNHVATSSCDLPVITVQRAPLFAELVAPLVAAIGVPIDLQVIIENRTSRTETLSLAVGRSDDFAFAGLEETQCAVRRCLLAGFALSHGFVYLVHLVGASQARMGIAFARLLIPTADAWCCVQLLPHTTRALDYVVVPLTCGKLQLPQFSLTSSRSDGEWFSDFSDERRAVLVNP